MSRRVSLPGADELFRVTGQGEIARPVGLPADPEPEPLDPASLGDGEAVAAVEPSRTRVVTRRSSRGHAGADRRSTGRERHEEKITVYVSGDELVDLEHARLLLRADHGLAVDRGRIVREALAVVLADFEAKGTSSILVRRLQEL
jgi:hypothetical protein